MGEGASQAVPDATVILCAADDDANGLVMVLAERVIDERDLEIGLAGIFELELARLELDDDVAR
jgi:hypothetical protein